MIGDLFPPMQMTSLTDPVVLSRALHLAAVAQMLGIVVFRAGIAWPASARRRLARLAWASLALAVASGGLWLWLLSRNSSGDFIAIATQTRFGWLTLARGCLALALACLLPRLARAPAGPVDWLLAALGAGLAGSLALAGHSGAGDLWQVLADGAHVLAACAWIGALAPLAICLRAPDADATRLARRFSTLGLVCVATLALTGSVNAWFLAGGPPGLLGTDWGLLMCVKLALFAAMLAFAAYNRLRLTPRLAGEVGAGAKLRRNALAELWLGLALLAVVALLGATPPGAHEQPVWPFSWRFDGGALYASGETANGAWRSLLSLVGAVLLAIGALLARRWRVPMFAAAVAAGAFASTTISSLTVPARPTTFQTSGAPYAPRSIAAGARHFAEHCAGCHGARGTGDGPLAAGLSTRPADLTQDHLFAHFDGDLFGWISDGLGAMPGFAGVLDAEARWSLVDFLRANADGARLAALGGRVAASAFPAPEFALVCPDGPATNFDLRGRALHVVVAGAGSESRLRQLSFLARQVETRVIVVRAGDAPPPDPVLRACVADDDDLLAALAIYAGANIDKLAGAELLIDADGRLRSMWRADMASDWRDPLVFRRALAETRVPQELARALGAVNSAPGARPELETGWHRH